MPRGDYLRTIAFDHDRASFLVGTRAAAIRGVAHFDPPSAFLAARKALENISSRDRSTYPYVLVELDKERAVSVLTAQLVDESHPTVIAAIGRALENADVDATLSEWFASPVKAHRVAATRLASWRPLTEVLFRAVRNALDDVSDGVAESARNALGRLGRAAEGARVVVALRSSRSDSRRSILLDALLEIADPGDENQAWPAWAREAAECLPPFMLHYMADRIQKRQHEIKKDNEKNGGMALS